MLIAKEFNGGIYVAQLGKTTGSDNPGTLPGWFFIGPGLRPTVSAYGPGVFLVLFDYMGVLNARLLNANAWPPEQVDPVTYTPFISIQRSEDAVAFSIYGSAGWGRELPDVMDPAGPLFRASDLLYDGDTDTYSTTISRDTGVNPDPNTRSGFRLYSKPMGAADSAWTLIQDWTSDIVGFAVNGSPKIQQDYCLTWGHLFDPDAPNDPFKRLESPKGAAFTLNSDVIPKTLKVAYFTTLPDPRTEGEHTNAWAYMEPKQTFFNLSHESPARAPQMWEGCSSTGVQPTWGQEYGKPQFFAPYHTDSSARVTLKVEGPATNSFARLEDRWNPTP